jgi:ATP-binding cassette, subfamily B, bacterial
MNNKKYEKNKSILSILKPYSLLIVYLVILTIVGNALNLVVPKIVSGAIDSYSQNKFDLQFVVIEFFLVSVSIFVFIYLQSIMQTYVSEKVARDLRTELADKISRQDFNYIQSVTPSKLLTNLTSDVDAVK